MLHLGDDDLVTRAEFEPGRRWVVGERRVAERVGDQVDRLGGVLGEDDLVGPPDAHERCDPLPGGLVEIRSLFRELVRAAVDGGVVPGDVFLFGVDHWRRALRGGPGIQVHQRLPVPDGALQDREVGADPVDVDRRQ
jgi:hypothetical protein